MHLLRILGCTTLLFGLGDGCGPLYVSGRDGGVSDDDIADVQEFSDYNPNDPFANDPLAGKTGPPDPRPKPAGTPPPLKQGAGGLENALGTDLTTQEWDSHRYVAEGGGPIREGGFLDCDFESECCYRNALDPEDRLQWRLVTPDFDENINRQRAEATFGRSGLPRGKFLAVTTIGPEDPFHEARFFSCSIGCTNQPILVTLDYWLSPEVKLSVCLRNSWYSGPNQPPNLINCVDVINDPENPGKFTAWLPPGENVDVAIVASNFLHRDGGAALIDNIEVEYLTCEEEAKLTQPERPTTTVATTTTVTTTTTTTTTTTPDRLSQLGTFKECETISCDFESRGEGDAGSMCNWVAAPVYDTDFDFAEWNATEREDEINRGKKFGDAEGIEIRKVARAKRHAEAPLRRFKRQDDGEEGAAAAVEEDPNLPAEFKPRTGQRYRNRITGVRTGPRNGDWYGAGYVNQGTAIKMSVKTDLSTARAVQFYYYASVRSSVIVYCCDEECVHRPIDLFLYDIAAQNQEQQQQAAADAAAPADDAGGEGEAAGEGDEAAPTGPTPEPINVNTVHAWNLVHIICPAGTKEVTLGCENYSENLQGACAFDEIELWVLKWDNDGELVPWKPACI